MRHLFLAMCVAAVPVAAQQAPPSALGSIEVDRIVAVVANHPILFSEVLEQISYERARGVPIPPDSLGQLQMAREILSRLVDEQVLVTVARQYKIEVSDADVLESVEVRLDQIRGQFNSEQEFQTALQREGFGTMESFRRQSLDQAKRQELQKIAVDSLRSKGRLAPVNVAEREVSEAFERFRSNLPPRPATIGFRQLLISPSARDESRFATRHRLDSIRVAIENGASFDSVARAISQDGSAAEGGDLGWNRRGSMVAEFDRMMFALNVGRVSPIVETTYGFHLIRVDRVRAAEVRARHILLRPEIDSADVARARVRADSALVLWRSGVPFDSLVKMYHDPAEERTLPEGFPRDSLPVEYRLALRDVPANGFSEVFELPNPNSGIPKFAVVQVTGMKEPGSYTLEEYQERLRQQLREEKALRRTLDNLRRDYYVSLRL